MRDRPPAGSLQRGSKLNCLFKSFSFWINSSCVTAHCGVFLPNSCATIHYSLHNTSLANHSSSNPQPPLRIPLDTSPTPSACSSWISSTLAWFWWGSCCRGRHLMWSLSPPKSSEAAYRTVPLMSFVMKVLERLVLVEDQPGPQTTGEPLTLCNSPTILI